jgi:branched-chain amino acid transport system permease protein
VSGYFGAELAVLCIAVIYAYGVFVPVATGQLNLGGAGFQATGAYTAALLNAQLGLPGWVTVPAGTLAGALVAMLIAVPVLRTRGAYMVLATMAFSELVGGLVLATPYFGGATGMPVPDYIGLPVLVPITLAVLLLVGLLMSTRLGLAMRALHDDEAVAALMGVSARRLQVFGFGLGGALVGLSGALYAHQFGFVNADAFDVIQSVDVLLCVLLGGTQTVWGPLVGTVVFTLLPEALRNLLPWLALHLQHALGGLGLSLAAPDASWRFVILGICTVAMMALRPEGLVTRRMVERIGLPARRRLASAA